LGKPILLTVRRHVKGKLHRRHRRDHAEVVLRALDDRQRRRHAPHACRRLARDDVLGSLDDLHVHVLLAGANQSGKADVGETTDGHEGILTAEEIGTQNLDGVQLVVLSACESGLGKQASGEGLLGLQRSFQSAGARTVVASLWPVDDKATAVLMRHFYQNLWWEKMPPIEALRQAQLYVYRHPDETADPAPRGLGTARPLPDGGAVKPGSKTAPSPQWASFVIVGVGD
jgi:CHAT domain-containing protein